MGRQRARKKSKKQHCAYCSWDAPVSPNGKLGQHYNGAVRCVGSGFVASQMAALVRNINAELRRGLA